MSSPACGHALLRPTPPSATGVLRGVIWGEGASLSTLIARGDCKLGALDGEDCRVRPRGLWVVCGCGLRGDVGGSSLRGEGLASGEEGEGAESAD